MEHWIFGALLAALGGAGIAYVNYRAARAVLRQKPSMYPAASALRQVLQIAYLLAVYFFADYTPWQRNPMLIGAVVGLTGMLFVTTAALVRENDRLKTEKQPQKSEKQEEKQ